MREQMSNTEISADDTTALDGYRLIATHGEGDQAVRITGEDAAGAVLVGLAEQLVGGVHHHQRVPFILEPGLDLGDQSSVIFGDKKSARFCQWMISGVSEDKKGRQLCGPQFSRIRGGGSCG
jgi:hypothetical protein